MPGGKYPRPIFLCSDWLVIFLTQLYVSRSDYAGVADTFPPRTVGSLVGLGYVCKLRHIFESVSTTCISLQIPTLVHNQPSGNENQ